MNTGNALAVIENQYGGVEDFAYHLLGDEERRQALDDSLPLVRRAEIAGLPLPVFARVITSTQFRTILRSDLVNRAFDLMGEREHIEQVAGIARGKKRTVVSNKGNLVEVDQAPQDIIAAGKYLNELRGTPIDAKAPSVGGITVNIHNALGETEVRDAQVTVEVAPAVHQPRRAGDLPPPGVLGRRREAVPDAATGPGTSVDGGLGTLYGPGAEEADEAHALAEKAKRLTGRNEVDEPSVEEPEEERRSQRIRWPGRHARAVRHKDRNWE